MGANQEMQHLFLEAGDHEGCVAPSHPRRIEPLEAGHNEGFAAAYPPRITSRSGIALMVATLLIASVFVIGWRQSDKDILEHEGGNDVIELALFNPSDDVVELTSGNFGHEVLHTDGVVLVMFYAPRSGHCKSLAPEWKDAASALKGVVKVGSVDMDAHGKVGGPYNVRGFPNIKIFGVNKNSPQDYYGARRAQGIVDAALKAVKDLVNSRTSGNTAGGGGGGNVVDGDVIELTDDNFAKKVFGTKNMALVEFYAPWCGHCQRLAPEWKKAAKELGGKVVVGALDATVHTVMASRLQVQGYPTIKWFPAGSKDINSAGNYVGGRTSSDIVAFANAKYLANAPAPVIYELLGSAVLEDQCMNNHRLCVIAVLPAISDSSISKRHAYLQLLKDTGDKYRTENWGWIWAPAGVHAALEHTIGIDKVPGVAMMSPRKKLFALSGGSFSKTGLDDFFKAVKVGKVGTQRLERLPEVKIMQPWDGKDTEEKELKP